MEVEAGDVAAVKLGANGVDGSLISSLSLRAGQERNGIAARGFFLWSILTRSSSHSLALGCYNEGEVQLWFDM